MSRFYGTIGFINYSTEHGVTKEILETRQYRGDLVSFRSSWSQGNDTKNDDFNLSNRISILGDPFAYENFSAMKYVEFGGARWKITSVEVSYPRLILTVGGLYNNHDPITNSGSIGSLI